MKIFFYFFTLLLSFTLWAEPLPQNNLSLSLNEFIEQAKKNDPEMQSIISDRLRTKYLVDLGLPSRQILLSVQNEYGFTRKEDPTSVLSAVISKPILESGTVISASKTITERPDRTEDVTQMRVEQALYRNAFGRAVRKTKENLEVQKSLIEIQVIESYEDYLSLVIQRYMDLTLSYLSFQAAEKLQAESKLLLKNVRKRRQQNIASETDLKRAELQLALRSENVLQARVNMESLGRGLIRILGLEKSEMLIPETGLNMQNRLESVEIDINRFLIASRSRLIYDKQENVAANNLSLAKEALKPEANLLVGFNIDNSRRFSTAINREEAVVGVNIDIPLGNTLVEAQIQEASYQLLKSKLQKKSFDAAIKESLLVIKNKILRQRELLEIHQKKKELAAQIVKDQTKRYLIGRVTLENLIEDRNNEAQYEFAYLSELTILNKLVVQWLALTDQLVEKLP